MLGRGFRRQRMITVIAEVLNTSAATPKMEAALSGSRRFLLHAKLSDRLVFPEHTSVEAFAKAGRSEDTFSGLYLSQSFCLFMKQNTLFRLTFVYFYF